MVGAWVGGEYRCIHFRTGQLGQGNRTALPICGYFLGAVLADKQFAHYRTKFKIPNDVDININDYNCGGYLRTLNDSDSLKIDSLATDEFEEIDEEGNPIIHHKVQKPDEEQTIPAESTGETATLEATEPKKRRGLHA